MKLDRKEYANLLTNEGVIDEGEIDKVIASKIREKKGYCLCFISLLVGILVISYLLNDFEPFVVLLGLYPVGIGMSSNHSELRILKILKAQLDSKRVPNMMLSE